MRLRIFLVGGAGLAVGAVVWLSAAASPPPAAPAPAVSTATARVTRGDVTQRVQVAGTLGYDGVYPVVSQLPAGILTATAAPGTTVVRGGTLFAVSGVPAVLLYGSTPAYRAFAPGMDDGPDVRVLERNLVALGLDPSHAIRVDDHFGPATADAVRRWQAARGVPRARRTGTVPLGQIVFLPAAVRVGQVVVDSGTTVAPGQRVLSATSTTRVVTARLDVDRLYLVHAGDKVRVALPAGGTVTGTVSRVGQVPVDAGAPGGAGTPGGDGQVAVPVTIALRLPDGAADLDRAPVQVAVTTDRRSGVLMVPVVALLAKPGGGYQVRVLSGGGARLADVRPGLYDDAAGTVEVAGGGLVEGAIVEVPA